MNTFLIYFETGLLPYIAGQEQYRNDYFFFKDYIKLFFG